MAASDWQPKVREVLVEFSRRADFTEIRARICSEAKITQARFSQFMSFERRSFPTLETAAIIAKHLNISLDRLVLGRSESKLDYGPLADNMLRMIADQRKADAQHARLFVRMAQILQDGITQAVEDLRAVEARPFGVEVLEARDIQRLQECSNTSWIASLKLRDVRQTDRGVTGTGPFFATVVNNLKRGRKYRFLLSWQVRDVAALARNFRDELVRQGGNLSHIEFAITQKQSPLLATAAFLQLDVAQLRDTAPVLHEIVSLYTVVDKEQQPWIGYASPPCSDPLIDLLMDTDHLDWGLQAFAALWKKADKQA